MNNLLPVVGRGPTAIDHASLIVGGWRPATWSTELEGAQDSSDVHEVIKQYEDRVRSGQWVVSWKHPVHGTTTYQDNGTFVTEVVSNLERKWQSGFGPATADAEGNAECHSVWCASVYPHKMYMSVRFCEQNVPLKDVGKIVLVQFSDFYSDNSKKGKIAIDWGKHSVDYFNESWGPYQTVNLFSAIETGYYSELTIRAKLKPGAVLSGAFFGSLRTGGWSKQEVEGSQKNFEVMMSELRKQ